MLKHFSPLHRTWTDQNHIYFWLCDIISFAAKTDNKIRINQHLTNLKILFMEMKEITFNSAGDLEIIPSPTSSQNDFDFLIGKWKIHTRRLKTRLNNCTEWLEFEATDEVDKILNGLGNIQKYLTVFDGEPFEGVTLRLFNPKTRLWSIYWADSSTGILDIPVVGSFENNIGHFYAKDIFDNKEIVASIHWDATDRNNPVGSQAFSADGGKTWEWNLYMYASKIE
jgi:hypothetical protein